MIRALGVAFIVALLPAAVAAAAPAKTASVSWVDTVVATPDGGYRIGNPAAAVKLVEYGSLTCPHCAAFHAEAMAALTSKYIAGGKVSFEFRNFVLNGPDLAASLLARCQAPRGYFPAVAAFYSEQPKWTEPFAHPSDADTARIQSLPQDQQIAAMAEAGKLGSFVAPLGITPPRFKACLTDKAAADKLLAMRKVATETWKLTGTPGFIVNGKVQEGVYTWATLEPLLQAALR